MFEQARRKERPVPTWSELDRLTASEVLVGCVAAPMMAGRERGVEPRSRLGGAA
jgi:hypothetical protein